MSSVLDSALSRAGSAWSRVPIFWKFQLVGWSAYVVLSFPFKILFVGSADAALWISLLRDAMALLLTLGMRTIYKWAYERRMSAERVALLIAVASLAAGWLLALLSLEVQRIILLADPSVMHAVAQTRVAYFCVSLCVAWSALYFGIRRMREASALELRLALIESERREAQLQMLRAQMNPHFLFNALNTISAAAGKHGRELKQLVRAFADYLRFSIDHADTDRVPLGKEFDALVGYLEVEKARFRDKFTYECSITDEARRVRVPGVLLQPLVENAVKYGQETSPVALTIRLHAHCPQGGRLVLEVSNTGRWIKDGAGHGMGLGNVRKRLELLFPDDYRLDVGEAEGWVTVRLDLPAEG